jgi:hypothetical protein
MIAFSLRMNAFSRRMIDFRRRMIGFRHSLKPLLRLSIGFRRRKKTIFLQNIALTL